MENKNDLRKTSKKSIKCIESFRDISVLKCKEDQNKKKEIKKRFQSKSPLRTKNDAFNSIPPAESVEGNFDASDISDIEKLILSEKQRNKSARLSINRVTKVLNEYYVSNDPSKPESTNNKLKSNNNNYNTEFYIQYCSELEKQYNDMEENNEILEKELLSYRDLDEDNFKLKLELTKYNQFKLIAKEFCTYKNNDLNISFCKNDKNSNNNSFISNKSSLSSNFLKNDLKNPHEFNKKSTVSPTKINNNIYDMMNNKINKCDNVKCLENKKMFEELRKMTLKLKLENKGWMKKVQALENKNIDIKDFFKEKSIFNVD